MAGPLIRLGDKTSHSGTVIEASPHSDIDGTAIARIDGKPAARHGDKTACGATLIAGQQTTIDNL